MFDRIPLKTALLAGACIIVPLSQATGDNRTSFPAMGIVIPGGVGCRTFLRPPASHRSCPVSSRPRHRLSRLQPPP